MCEMTKIISELHLCFVAAQPRVPVRPLRGSVVNHALPATVL